MNLQEIKQILLQVGSVDNDGDYWGHDTSFGNIDEFVAEIAEDINESARNKPDL